MNTPTFPLRLHEMDRNRGRQLSEELDISENRLYAGLIHDGLLMQEQMLYMAKLKEIAASTSTEAALAILDKAPETRPLPTDVY
jgi:hypothetical protein